MRGLVHWRGIFLAAVVAWSLAVLVRPVDAHANGRVALVIGNSDYKNVARLANPDRDAKAVADLFKRIGFDVTLVLDQDRDSMAAALKAFGRAAENADIAAVYYAGHGMEADGQNYLIPVDAALASDLDIGFELISLDQVLRTVSGAKQLSLVILDACRNNPFAAKMANAGGKRAIGRGFRRVEPATNTLVAYAAKDGTVAEDGNGDHSPFASALLKHLGDPGLAVNFVFGKVRDDVLAATSGQQEPFVYGSLGGEAYYLVPPKDMPATPPAMPTANPEQETVFWQSVKDSTDARDYQAYLKHFPNGIFADLAEVRLARLQAGAPAGDAKGAAQVAALTPPAPVTPPGPAIDDLDATYVAKQTANVRAEPDATAKTLGRLAPDDAVSVTGRVRGTDWLRVQLGSRAGYVNSSSLAEVDAGEIADWKTLQTAPKLEAAQAFLQHHPNGYFKDRATALVAQLTPPPEPAVEDLNATYVAKQAATLRAEPNNSAKPLGKLSADDGVAVTGKMKGRDWVRVKLGDQVGYIPFAAVVASSDGEIADWKALQATPKLEAAQAYLQKYPAGYFKPRVSAMVAQLTPPPGPEVDDLNATYIAKQTATVRSEPSNAAKSLGKLSADDGATITGKVKNKDWFRIKLGDQVGYIASSTVVQSSESEIADWKALQAAPKLDAAQAYLQKYPDGYFKPRVSAMVAQLTPPPGPEIEYLNATYIAKQTATVRAEPSNAAKSLGKFSADEDVPVTGKVKNKEWLRVKLNDQAGYLPSSVIVASSDSEIADWKALQAMPKLEAAQAYLQKYSDGYFKPRVSAMVAQLTPPPPGPEIEELDATFVARQTVSVRELPSPQAPLITRLSEDDGVSVTGRVKGKDWLRVTVSGKTGYASAGLLAKADAGEIADWRALQPSPKPETVQAFLTRYPDGYFKSKASALLAELQPPEPKPAAKVAIPVPEPKPAAPATQVAAAPSVSQPPATKPGNAPAAVAPAPPKGEAKEIKVGDVYHLVSTLYARNFAGNPPLEFAAEITITGATGSGFSASVVNRGQFQSPAELAIERDGERFAIHIYGDQGTILISLNRIKPGEYSGTATGHVVIAYAGLAKMTIQTAAP